MEQPVNITEIIPAEISGYCDAETGECITTETGIPHATSAENVAHTDDDTSTMPDEPA
jgi:hypothetical protein